MWKSAQFFTHKYCQVGLYSSASIDDNMSIRLPKTIMLVKPVNVLMRPLLFLAPSCISSLLTCLLTKNRQLSVVFVYKLCKISTVVLSRQTANTLNICEFALPWLDCGNFLLLGCVTHLHKLQNLAAHLVLKGG